jgi:lipopolysaccharide biosynthesis protein
MKNLVRKFPTNKMERNDTFREYNNKIPFKYELFMYFLRSSRRNPGKVSFASFTEFSFVCHLRHLNDGNFSSPLLTLEFSKKFCQVLAFE